MSNISITGSCKKLPMRNTNRKSEFLLNKQKRLFHGCRPRRTNILKNAVVFRVERENVFVGGWGGWSDHGVSMMLQNVLWFSVSRGLITECVCS